MTDMAGTPKNPLNTPNSDMSEPRLQAELNQLRRKLALFANLSRRLAATLDPIALLDEVVDAGLQITDAKYGALGVFDAEGKLEQFIAHGIEEGLRQEIGDLPVGHGLLGMLQVSQEPLRLADLGAHAASVGFPPNHPPMHSFLGVPVRYEGQPLGNLYLTEKNDGGGFTDEDESMLLLLADQAAMAIHNAALHAAAEDERARLRTLVETSPVGVLIVRKGEEEVRLVNREAARLLGGPDPRMTPVEGEVLQAHERHGIYRRRDGTEYELEELPLSRALEHRERVTAEEFFVELPDGSVLPTITNATPVFDVEGNITGAIATIQGITPIEELERLRNEFLGMVSHELKTPLTAIKGSAAMALGTKRLMSADESNELFEIIDEEADRLRDLVDNLLDVTRIEAGTLSVSPEPIELGAAIDDARSTLERAAGMRAVLKPDLSKVPALKADSRRLGQVLNNLLSNAAKFSPDGSIIEILATADATVATIAVRDSGRGFPEGQAEAMFTKFMQLPDQLGKTGAGHGLGLAICRGIVEAQGGRIWAESAGLDQSSTFSFTVPVASERPSSPTADVTQRASHLGHISRPGERTRVLVIDDEPQILRYVQRTVEEAGFRAIVTGDPEEALRMVESDDPDMVLIDLQLPGIDGFELLRRVRELSGVPVMFLTARSDSEVAARALRAGAGDYVTKPFAPSELVARIEASLRRRVLSDQTEVRAPYKLGGLELDFNDRRVVVDGVQVALSATEYKLPLELAMNAGRVLTHDQILHNVWGPEYSGENELVRSFIRNLRRKLGDDARNPRYILTEPQVGYRMARPL
jgi:DNA-binding response OmpR family regulator/signal transduction histidine kinase